MYFQYPLETLARKRGSRAQIDFAQEAKEAMRDDDDVLSEPLAHGLAIFAANETALAQPVRILEELYGGEVEVRRPSVRLIEGEPVQEPVMHVRVRARVGYVMAVVQALRFRGVRILEECIRTREAIVRGEAPLASLMGLPAELDRLTDGSAVHWIRLTHYAPVAD
jgi:elongation factor G-like protein